MTASPLIATLARLRRRAVLVALVRYGVLWLALVAAGVPLLLFAALPRPAFALPLAALAIAGALAVARAPSLRNVAARADEAFALEDRLVTALQHVKDNDIMSRLVVRDAETRLASVSPGRVYPIQAPRRMGAAIAVSATVSLLGLLVVSSARPARVVELRGTDNVTADDPAPAAATSAAGPSASTRARTAVASAAPASIRTSPAARPGSNAQAAPAPAGNEPPRPSGTPAGATGQAGRRGLPAGTPGNDLARRTTDETGSGAGLGSNSVSAKAGGQGDTLPREPGGRSAAFSARTARDRRQYEAARGDAEAAMAREHVPPGLRDYVKAYFNAIRPR